LYRRSLDADSDGKLTLGEFTALFRHSFPALLTDTEARLLFDLLDAQDDRLLDILLIFDNLRRPLDERCKGLLDLAYDRMDTDGAGLVDAATLAAAYDAARHPEVLSGSRSAADEYADFLSRFEMGGESAGHVSRRELLSHYTSEATALNDDHCLALIIGNCWLDPSVLKEFEDDHAKLIETKKSSSRKLPVFLSSFVSGSPYNIISLENTAETNISRRRVQAKGETSIYDRNMPHPVTVEGGAAYLLKKAAALVAGSGRERVFSLQAKLR
jgi:Ca2+-binding EF-hand superfamily protein